MKAIKPSPPPPFELFDCHAHLDEFADLNEVLEQAAGAGVTRVIAVGVNVRTSRRILEIAAQPSPVPVSPAIGLYPDEVTRQELEDILSLIEEARDRVIALGEIGLDYWIRPLRKKQPGRQEIKALQQQAFRRQLEAARAADLPVIVHSRGAWPDAVRLVGESGLKRALFHWYSGPLEVLEEIIRRGYLVSATPAATSSPPLRAVIQAAPLENIVLETDCPVPRRVGERRVPTTPADVRISLRAVADLKGISLEETARMTASNAEEFFGLAP